MTTTVSFSSATQEKSVSLSATASQSRRNTSGSN